MFISRAPWRPPGLFHNSQPNHTPMKQPYLDQSKNEKGEIEFSLHRLTLDDLHALFGMVKTDATKTVMRANLISDQINDILFRSKGTTAPNKTLYDCLDYLRTRASRWLVLISSIRSKVETIESLDNPEVNFIESVTFKSKM